MIDASVLEAVSEHPGAALGEGFESTNGARGPYHLSERFRFRARALRAAKGLTGNTLVAEAFEMAADDIDAFCVQPSPPIRVSGSTLHELERAAILEALASHHGVQIRAASALGISARMLNFKMKMHGIPRPVDSRDR